MKTKKEIKERISIIDDIISSCSPTGNKIFEYSRYRLALEDCLNKSENEIENLILENRKNALKFKVKGLRFNQYIMYSIACEWVLNKEVYDKFNAINI
jgi:hypothetical protein